MVYCFFRLNKNSKAMAFSTIRRRTKDKIFIEGLSAYQITGCKLPSNHQEAATLYYSLPTAKLNLRGSARIT